MQLSDPAPGLVDDLRARLPDPLPARIGVAVSGGSDSMALLHLLHRCVDGTEVQVLAATVDHGLRPEAVAEARHVEHAAARLGIPHVTLRWDGWDGQGNLQDEARRARYRLLTQWARSNGIGALVTAHTRDDQAETLMMRLSRAAGVSGLAGIPSRRVVHDVPVLRPLLNRSRAELRGHLEMAGIAWVEDPSNTDQRFERVRVRQALADLAPLGIDAETLASVAGNMDRADRALSHYAEREARDEARIEAGDVVFHREALSALPDEITRRLLDRAIRWVAGHEHPPRRAPLAGLQAEISAGRSGALGGCRVLVSGAVVRVCREYAAVSDLRAAISVPWDGRWQAFPPEGGDPAGGATVAPLGEAGLAHCRNWREAGRPHAAVLADPAIWRGSVLVAAPTVGHETGWRLQLLREAEEFFISLLSH